MKKTTFLILFSTISVLAACQSVSQQFNGQTGYQVEQKTASTATLSYTLASDRNPAREARKLQDACQHTLGQQKNYQIKVLSSQEINSPMAAVDSSSVAIGNTNTSFGFSHTPHLNNSQEAYAARQVEETRPNILKVIRFSCA